MSNKESGDASHDTQVVMWKVKKLIKSLQVGLSLVGSS